MVARVMHRATGRIGLWSAAFCVLLCPLELGAQEGQTRSALSEKIQQIIDSEGVQAAERWWTEEYPSQIDEYEVDYEGFSAVAQNYMQAGEYETGTLVMRIMSEAAMAGMPATAAAMATPSVPPEPESSAAVPATPFVNPEPRTDLKRFYGLYAEPGQEEPAKGLIVTEMCGGYLYVATTWGDGTPWLMHPVSDTEFEYADSWVSLKLSFDLSGDGSAHHDLDFLSSPLPRIGPRPEGWEACIPDMRG